MTLPKNREAMPKRIIISRTDSIGDVILTFPMLSLLKENFPHCQIIFLGKSYTEPIIKSCIYIDEFANWDEIYKLPLRDAVRAFKELNADTIIHVFPDKNIARLAQIAKIKIRIGTSHRFFHLTTVNKLVKFTRKKSDLHEAQLNVKLLKPLGIDSTISFDYIAHHYGMKNIEPLQTDFQHLLSKGKFNLILHPKSKGSAKEWGLNNFAELINRLDETKYNIFITGTAEERDFIGDNLPFEKENITDLCSKMPLSQLISFISKADGLLAASTGPLHIASAIGVYAIGLFSAKRPIHPGRWAPIGEKSHYLVYDENCPKCTAGKNCDCISKISVDEVVSLLDKCGKR